MYGWNTLAQLVPLGRRFQVLLLIAMSFNAQAETVPPLGYNYQITLHGTTEPSNFPTPEAAATAYISNANSYYSDPTIIYTLLRIKNCSEVKGDLCGSIDWYFDFHFKSRTSDSIHKNQKIWTRLICPPGYISGVSYNKCWRANPPPQPALALSLTASMPTIPIESRVAGGKVQTEVDLVATLTQNGKAVQGKSVTLLSNRGETVDQARPSWTAVTGGDGRIITEIVTRTQPGTSTLTAKGDGVTSPAKLINWLPAKYDESFLVTCYTIANEELAPAEPARKNVCGLPDQNSYRTAFLKDVKMQGSGTALDGSIIHYAGYQCYEILSCALTASGACAKEGETIAVDMTVIPRRSKVNVAILGARKAQDKGGMIKGYHIDEYVGPQPEMCKKLGRRSSAITLDSY